MRTAGIVRWPGRTKAGRVSNEIVSILDFYASFAHVAGAADRMPADRAMDSIEMSEFLFGDGEASGRDHTMIFYKDALLSIKWRNFKVHFSLREPARGTVEVPGQSAVAGHKTELDYPYVFDVENDPKELWDIGFMNGWANREIARIRLDYAKSVARYPNIAPGGDRPGQAPPAETPG